MQWEPCRSGTSSKNHCPHALDMSSIAFTRKLYMGKAKILIVEDDSAIAKLLNLLLTTSGYTVSGVVSTGEKAIDLASKTQPDLILMDIKLNGRMDGITAYEQIKKNARIPVVYISAYTEQSLVWRAILSEPGGYIVKPFKKEELLNKIESILHWQKTPHDSSNRE